VGLSLRVAGKLSLRKRQRLGLEVAGASGKFPRRSLKTTAWRRRVPKKFADPASLKNLPGLRHS
jgi:hypothetical protein